MSNLTALRYTMLAPGDVLQTEFCQVLDLQTIFPGIAQCAAIAPAITFDGSTTYLDGMNNSGSGTDDPKGILSLWVRFASLGTVMYVVDTIGDRVQVFKGTDDKFRILGLNPTKILELRNTTALAHNSWIHLLASWDCNAGAGHVYINDSEDKDQRVLLPGGIDYTRTEWAIGGSESGGSKLSGCVAQVYFNFGEYLDLSVQTNRRKFITAAGGPVDLGADGSTPTGAQPDIYLNNEPSTFYINLGTESNFVQNGSAASCASDP